VLWPGPGLDLLAELDEDTRDRGRVRLLPSGRAVPKVQGGEDERWLDGRLWPASRGLGDDQSAAYLDLHNIRAVEPDFESRRGDRDFGDEDSADALAPADAVKGDIARTLFYMSLRYDGRDGGASLQLVARPAAIGESAMGGLCTLLAWNESDPVNSGEQRRNDRVERYQGNRNPFVDRPEFARVLWGRECPEGGSTS
jgi:endonuclease I